MKNSNTFSSRRDVLRLGGAGVAGLTLGAFTLGAQAQTAWPNKPVTLVVPFPAGGGTDAFAPVLGPICQANRQDLGD